MARFLHRHLLFFVLLFSSVALSAVLAQQGSTDADQNEQLRRSSPTTPNWKCPPNLRRFCTLPNRFAQNVVSTGRATGCVPGARMRPGSFCTVRCKPGTTAISPGATATRGVVTYRCIPQIIARTTSIDISHLNAHTMLFRNSRRCDRGRALLHY
jgi:hypothetical protein